MVEAVCVQRVVGLGDVPEDAGSAYFPALPTCRLGIPGPHSPRDQVLAGLNGVDDELHLVLPVRDVPVVGPRTGNGSRELGGPEIGKRRSWI